MDFFRSMDVAASGMRAEQFRMDVTAENIANVNTTSSVDGTPYRRKMAVITPADEPEFMLPAGLSEDEEAGFIGGGVQTAGVMEDKSADFKYVYDPENPQAQKEGKWKGYVAMPNVNIITEMTSLIAASRSYEANVTALQSAKTMAQKALDIGRR